MSRPPVVQVWTLGVDAVDEAAAARWRAMLDNDERARAERFVFARHRIQYIAAHALVRTTLSKLMPDALPGDWRFTAGDNSKPIALHGDRPAPLSFNLSHTDGMVGVAAVAQEGCALGFDLETIDRKVAIDSADRYFRAEEVAWLRSLPEPERVEGFLRLWTLKEAFIKATGEGLSRDLATFWFKPLPPHIHFVPPFAANGLSDQSEDWHFEQRIIASRFVAAVGLCRPGGPPPPTRWTRLTPDQGGDQILFRTWS